MASNKLKNTFLFFIIVSLFFFSFSCFQQKATDFFYNLKVAENPPKFYLAKIVKANWGRGQAEENKKISQEISAKSAGLFVLQNNGRKIKMIFGKNAFKKSNIASLTKLMTAAVALNFYDKDDRIKVSKEAVNQMENTGKLIIGEELRVKDLLKIMLIESSNDAAYALTEPIGEKQFVSLMNIKAKEIGMADSYFFDPMGLDREDKQDNSKENYSSAYDLAKLASYIIKEHKEIFKITSNKKYKLVLENGKTHHILKNTNKLLGKIGGIIGGKTGYTDRAGQCLLLLMKRGNNYYLSIVLGSEDRFKDSLTIINNLIKQKDEH